MSIINFDAKHLFGWHISTINTGRYEKSRRKSLQNKEPKRSRTKKKLTIYMEKYLKVFFNRQQSTLRLSVRKKIESERNSINQLSSVKVSSKCDPLHFFFFLRSTYEAQWTFYCKGILVFEIPPNAFDLFQCIKINSNFFGWFSIKIESFMWWKCCHNLYI